MWVPNWWWLVILRILFCVRTDKLSVENNCSTTMRTDVLQSSHGFLGLTHVCCFFMFTICLVMMYAIERTLGILFFSYSGWRIFHAIYSAAAWWFCDVALITLFNFWWWIIFNTVFFSAWWWWFIYICLSSREKANRFYFQHQRGEHTFCNKIRILLHRWTV